LPIGTISALCATRDRETTTISYASSEADLEVSGTNASRPARRIIGFVAESNWVRQLAEVQRQQGAAAAEIFRSALRPFMEALFRTIRNDLSMYYNEFSEETNFIEEGTTAEGRHFIKKCKSETRCIGVIPAVEFACELTDMVLVCRFHHATHLDREFQLILDHEGHMAVPGMSVGDLSKYLLAPVLFDTIPIAELGLRGLNV
jgi:hypothetical protein